MKILHKISVFILLLIITFSSVGISFYLHQCGCRETTLYTIETGYTKPTEFCCCAVEMPKSDHPLAGHQVEAESCCKDHFYFFILPIGPDKADTFFSSIDGKTIAFINPASILDTDEHYITEAVPMLHSPPALLTGKQLIFFIQQIKIPFPAC
jgi:hypothetical protein